MTILIEEIVIIKNRGKPKMKQTHTCQICGRKIDDTLSLAHIRAEEYIIELIRRDHPEWNKDRGTCDLCVEYYRELIKRTEI